MKKGIGHEESSGNVFADIGLPNADEHLIKAQLVTKIGGLMKARGLYAKLHDLQFAEEPEPMTS